MLRRFPRTLDYINGLPKGLASFPELEVHTDGLGDVRDIIDPPFDELPEPLGAFFRRELTDDWVPEVLGQCTTLTICDIHGEEYLYQASRELAERLYQGSALRGLIRIMSPTLILMGTQRRWSKMRRGGTSMSATPVKKDGRWNTCEVAVQSPHPIYTEPFAKALEPFLELAIASARGNDPSTELVEVTPTTLRYHGRWTA